MADRKTGPLETLRRARSDEPYNLTGLSEYLQVVKAKYPDMTDATLLLEKDIPYDALVQVMDTMRILEQRGLSLDDRQRARVHSERSFELLLDWLGRAAVTPSVEHLLSR